MGLFRKRVQNGVRGTARVVSLSQAPHAATHGNLRMTVVVEAPGIPAYSHIYGKLVVRVDKWPSPGDVVPVVVDPADPRQVEVLWDDMPTNRDAALHQADQMAALLRQQGGSSGPGGGESPVPPEASGLVDQLQQMFPGAVVQVGNDAVPGPDPGPGPRVVASQSDGDPVERLEKLARLRDAGIVDQAQFEQLRAQILDQAGLDDL